MQDPALHSMYIQKWKRMLKKTKLAVAVAAAFAVVVSPTPVNVNATLITAVTNIDTLRLARLNFDLNNVDPS